MMTLKDALINIDYNPSWGVWTESFNLDSPARYGQTDFENGGLLDGYKYCGNGVTIGDRKFAYTEGDEDLDDEWAELEIERLGNAFADE